MLNRATLNDIYDALQQIDPQPNAYRMREAAGRLRGLIQRLTNEPPDHIINRLRVPLSTEGAMVDMVIVGNAPLTSQEVDMLEQVFQLTLHALRPKASTPVPVQEADGGE